MSQQEDKRAAILENLKPSYGILPAHPAALEWLADMLARHDAHQFDKLMSTDDMLTTQGSGHENQEEKETQEA